MDVNHLHAEYDTLAPRAERLRQILCDQIEQLLRSKDLVLGVPLESRVKSWASIAEKLDRKALRLEKLAELQDFVGVCIILLFRRDLETATVLLRDKLEILSSEDAAERLTESLFGYQSVLHVTCIPHDWLAVPTLSDLGDLRAEIQVRTLAQHIWAAASHKLQYKQEDSVPLPVRRSINRVAALLETVDLEFERVLSERASYIAEAAGASKGTQTLNVDLLATVLDNLLPRANKEESEAYAELLDDLRTFGVRTADDLQNLISRQKAAIKQSETKEVERRRRQKDYFAGSKERIDRGVFFTHVGLARQALDAEFGKSFRDHLIAKVASRMPGGH
jgi:GTP pyrophosphokinase